MHNCKNNTYLITGGAGFIGSNFIEFLYKKEPKVKIRVLDKLTYSGNIENLNPFRTKSNFEFIHGDICDVKTVNQVIEGVDVVINFAAEVAVDRSINDSVNFLQTNVIGVYTLLNSLMRQQKLKRFIHISTDEVYGHIFQGSFTERSELKPRNPYAASKCGGDRLAYSFFETYGLPIVIIRASNNYGPRAYLEKVIPLFITNLINGHEIPIYGEGKQVRDWMFVEDHCRAIYMLIDNGINGEVYNVGGNQEYTNKELAKKILMLMNKDESLIKYVSDRPGHDFRYSLDCQKINGMGWYPQYDLMEGLNKTISWYTHNKVWWQPLQRGMDQRYITGYWGAKSCVESS